MSFIAGFTTTPCGITRIFARRTNYSKVANSYEGHNHFYNSCAAEVIAFCKERGIDYHIKSKTITKE